MELEGWTMAKATEGRHGSTSSRDRFAGKAITIRARGRYIWCNLVTLASEAARPV